VSSGYHTLEIKAEQLRDSESNLRLSMKLGRVGLWSYDLANEQLHVSTEWYSQIGYSDDELEGTLEELHRMIHPDDILQAQGMIESFLQNPSNSLKLEYRIQHKNGSYCWVRAEGNLLTDTSNNTVRILGCQLDITQLKQAEETLNQQRNQMRSFIQHAPVAMAMLDLNMNYLVTSGYWIKAFSKLNIELEGRNHYDCHPDLPAHRRDAHVKAMSGEIISKNDDLCLHADGTRVWTNWDARPWHTPNGAIGGIILMEVDINHLKELEGEIVKISTDEQQRIGQDLHDTLSQELTALRMITSELAEVLHSAPLEVVQLVNRIEKGLYRSRNDLRCLMNGLLPITIDCDASLLNALSDLAILTQDSGKIRCIVKSQENFKLEDQIIATHLYMIAQEAVHNAVKHANPGTIRIILASDPILSLQIENDGHLIDIHPKDRTNGLGIRIMKNRAAIIGGSLWIEPIKPDGMRVIFQLKGVSVE
jgi:PAS domain S-box-containing protein